ncbi:MAG: triose-phosphate isomerase [Thermoplasmata archaeon]|nr:triose-phosphate isomerase [Thermoplasmata archaeon]
MSTPSARDPGGPRSRPATDLAPLGSPILLLNLKSYPGSVGDGAERIGVALERQGRMHRVAVAVAPAPMDVGRLVRRLRIPVLAQHVDPLDLGAHTGYFLPEALFIAGGRGSLVNHSEHRIPTTEIREVVERLDRLGLVPVVCAKDVTESRRLARYSPPYLAVEPPELIGGDRSVSSARPEVVSGAVEAVRGVSKSTSVLCGAGVHDRHDVAAAIALGSAGVLVASAVTKAKDPEAAIAELLAGFPRTRAT